MTSSTRISVTLFLLTMFIPTDSFGRQRERERASEKNHRYNHHWCWQFLCIISKTERFFSLCDHLLTSTTNLHCLSFSSSSESPGKRFIYEREEMFNRREIDWKCWKMKSKAIIDAEWQDQLRTNLVHALIIWLFTEYVKSVIRLLLIKF